MSTRDGSGRSDSTCRRLCLHRSAADLADCPPSGHHLALACCALAVAAAPVHCWNDLMHACRPLRLCLKYRLIDDSTPVSQSRHTLRFQPIACRSIMRCPRVLTRPEMVWQAFVPDIASGHLAVFDMAEKPPGKRTCCYGQCKSDERYPVKCAGVTF